MSEHDQEPTNEVLRADLGKLAYRQTVRSAANTCYAASERIFELTVALEAMVYGLPDLLESIGYTDEEGLIAKAEAVLSKAKGALVTDA